MNEEGINLYANTTCGLIAINVRGIPMVYRLNGEPRFLFGLVDVPCTDLTSYSDSDVLVVSPAGKRYAIGLTDSVVAKISDIKQHVEEVLRGHRERLVQEPGEQAEREVSLRQPGNAGRARAAH